MTRTKLDPRTDLLLERMIDVPPHLVWTVWTTPEHLMKWYTPAPWKTVECEIDLRPGGIFRTVMQSPEGQKFPYAGCYLEVVKNQRLVWTFLLTDGFRPAVWESDVPAFTAVLELTPQGQGTKYSALAMHQDEQARHKHEQMGFKDGWGKVLDQLVVHAKTL